MESQTSDHPDEFYTPYTVFLRLQCPNAIGPVCKETLLQLLTDISTDGGPKCTPGVMKTIQWTLGASISGKPILSTSPTVEPTELIVPDGEEYFCVTQPCTPPGGKILDPTKFVTKPNTPTILVEMWHNIPTNKSYFEHIVDRILCHVQARLASAPNAWVYIMRYTLASSGSCSPSTCTGFKACQ